MPRRFGFCRWPQTLVILSVVALAACSSRPYTTAPAKALVRQLDPKAAAGADAPPVRGARAIAVCYGSTMNSAEEVLEEARLACPGGELTAWGTDMFWTSCGLLQPARANFICAPKPKTAD